jgi:hypothetical protein
MTVDRAPAPVIGAQAGARQLRVIATYHHE